MADSQYFKDRHAEGQLVVTEIPKFELGAYIANYKGKTRINRLHFIGTTSTQLCVEALQAAIKEAKKGKDVTLYQSVVASLQRIAPDLPEAVVDQNWVTKTSKEVQAETIRLEQELKGYKNNLIKESIRMGCEDLGHHYHATGDLSAAMKAYSKEREVVQSPAHMLVMHQHLMHVAIDQNNWISVQTTAERLRNIPQRPEVVPQIQHKVQSAIGLAQLATGQYKDAAMSFLETDPTMIQSNQDISRDYYADNEVLSANDIAIYAGLCALATMNRDELQKHVLNNTDFRNYLELEPHIRKAISFFVASKYSACLAILEAYKTDYLLDYYLHRHLEKIYFNVRGHAIIQYFVPFSCVTLQALAAAFNTDEPTIERTLANMIRDGTLDARIDLGDRVLLRRQIDQRKAVHQEALEMAKDYERSLQLRILRMEIINAGLEVPLETDKSMGMGIGNILNQTTGSNVGGMYNGAESKGKGKGLRGFFGQ